MQRVQRQFGKILPRTADEAQVGQLIKDFDHAVDLLTLLIKSTKAWQQSWKDILDSQERLTAGFANACLHIPGASEGSYNGPPPVETPIHISRRVTKIHQEYQALREELDPDIRSIDVQVLSPALQAKDAMGSMKKTIKTRENCKLDFERYQSRRDAIFKKSNRSDRDNIALSKHESDLDVARETYDRADQALRTALPGLLSAVYALVPQLLSALIRTGTTLFATYYTTIHEFCQGENFPSPPPPASEIIALWAQSCKPIQNQIESLSSCTNAKRGRLGGLGAAAPRVVSGSVSNSSNSPRISPSRDDASSTYSQDRMRRVPSGQFQQSHGSLSPGFRPPPSPNPNDHLTPASLASKPDYFSRDRIPSTSSAASVSSVGSAAASIAAGKKKPPPPPPKRIGSAKPELWVTALYDFVGQSQGDLRIREGDRIKVLKKTDSTNDWWEGECNGMRGAFPANYCKV